jgi:hypothetical protein
MREIVFSAPDYDTLLADAERLGFTYDIEGVTEIKICGASPNGGGWFLNLVGTLYDQADPPVARAGYWGRLRLNTGTNTPPPFADTITQYEYDEELGGWTSDGTTVAPEWVSLVGLIA